MKKEEIICVNVTCSMSKRNKDTCDINKNYCLDCKRLKEK